MRRHPRGGLLAVAAAVLLACGRPGSARPRGHRPDARGPPGAFGDRDPAARRHRGGCVRDNEIRRLPLSPFNRAITTVLTVNDAGLLTSVGGQRQLRSSPRRAATSPPKWKPRWCCRPSAIVVERRDRLELDTRRVGGSSSASPSPTRTAIPLPGARVTFQSSNPTIGQRGGAELEGGTPRASSSPGTRHPAAPPSLLTSGEPDERRSRSR